MSYEASLITAAVILIATLVVMVVVVAHRRRQAQEEELRRASSSRGWTFEALSAAGYRVHRWIGDTDGVSWTAESLRRQSGTHQQRVGRWHGDFSPGISKAIVIMGVAKGAEVPMLQVAQGESWVARLAQKAAGAVFDFALDNYFGKEAGLEVDATTLKRLDTVNLPGFIVAAGDKDEAMRVLEGGLERALTDASQGEDSVFSGRHRTSVLLRPEHISLARMAPLRDVNDVDAMVRAGVGLTQAFKFGRRA
jgi:hypothetical protein